MPVFQGVRKQRGHGLGSVLKVFFRSAWPRIETGAKAFGRQFFKTAMLIANEVAERHPFKDTSLKHIPEGIKAFVSSNVFKSQSGSGQKRRKQPLKKRDKRFQYDIFDKEDEEEEGKEEG